MPFAPQFLLLAATLPGLAQAPDEASRLFRAMEKRLTEADTLTLRFALAVEADGKTLFTLKGTVAIARGDRVRESCDRTGLGPDTRSELIADGKRLRTTVANAREGKVTTIACPKGLGATFVKVLTYTDHVSGWVFLDLTREQQLKPDAMFRIKDLKLISKEKVSGREAQMLSYSVILINGMTLPVALWIDVQTGLPLKRLTVFTNGGGSSRTTETFAEIRSNEKIDPRQFEVK